MTKQLASLSVFTAAVILVVSDGATAQPLSYTRPLAQPVAENAEFTLVGTQCMDATTADAIVSLAETVVASPDLIAVQKSAPFSDNSVNVLGDGVSVTSAGGVCLDNAQTGGLNYLADGAADAIGTGGVIKTAP